jgi:hypothetical protein
MTYRKRRGGCGCAHARALAERLESDGFVWETPPSGVRPERRTLLLHGTTAAAAQRIRENQAMAPQETFFALGWQNRDLARYFALRAAGNRTREGGPALVLVSVPATVVARLRGLGLFRMTGFDAGDRPELRNRRQWVLDPGGVDILNRGAESFGMVPVITAPGVRR